MVFFSHTKTDGTRLIHVDRSMLDMYHVTSHTRPSCFSACNIEKLGMGLGTRPGRKEANYTCTCMHLPQFSQ